MMNWQKSVGVALVLVAVAGCDSQQVDSNVTFNTTRSLAFVLPASTPANTDSHSDTIGNIDLAEYQARGSGVDLLKTAEVTRVQIQSNDQNFTLDKLVYARLLIGSDTVAFDSIPQFTGTTFQLTTRDTNIVTLMQDTTYPAELQFKLSSPLPKTETITATITTVYIGLSN